MGGNLVGVPFEIFHHEPFKARARRPGTVVNVALLHQSVTSSVAATERVLRKKGLGVHLMIDGDGSIHQYNDLADKVAHGNEMNGRSIGIEVINPYTKPRGYWTEIIEPSPTAWKGREVADTKEQIYTLDSLLSVLCSHCFDLSGSTLEIPLAMPTQSAEGPNRGSGLWFDTSVGGIVAHGHRPSRYPEGHPRAGDKVSGGHADARRTLWELYKRRQVVISNEMG